MVLSLKTYRYLNDYEVSYILKELETLQTFSPLMCLSLELPKIEVRSFLCPNERC